eukprot:TRINITY_DN6028_c0_g1_i2.p1 TRINITY_DN6028_c0_g1~~TRINITY_DN6028_c0_g1_i2.p1  ORF type:complete len:293 (-),score=64.66 TRINITY_DN6028_c0_g1_i2:58-936(-)
MYEFRKVKNKRYSNCYSHPLFQRGMSHLIKDIKRKLPFQEAQSAQKDRKTRELLQTLGGLTNKLTALESKENEYENLLQTYCGLMEKNQQLQQMIIYFSQSITGFTLKDLQAIEGNTNLRWNDDYLGMPLLNLFGDNYSFDAMPWSKLPFIAKIYDQFKNLSNAVEGPMREEYKSEAIGGREQRMIEGSEGFDLNSVQESSSLRLPNQLPELGRDSWSLASKSPNRAIEESIGDEPKYLHCLDIPLLQSLSEKDDEGSGENFDNDKSVDKNPSDNKFLSYNCLLYTSDAADE